MSKKLIWKESDESGGSFRVLRGGSWDYVVGFVRASYRGRFDPGFPFRDLGFRCARLLEVSHEDFDLEKE